MASFWGSKPTPSAPHLGLSPMWLFLSMNQYTQHIRKCFLEFCASAQHISKPGAGAVAGWAAPTLPWRLKAGPSPEASVRTEQTAAPPASGRGQRWVPGGTAPRAGVRRDPRRHSGSGSRAPKPATPGLSSLASRDGFVARRAVALGSNLSASLHLPESHSQKLE